jgi:hypothetical protein
MAVTVITQTITTIINSRGRHLLRGLTDLLQQLDPALTATLSKEVAGAILTHSLVSGSRAPLVEPIGGAGSTPAGSLQRARNWLLGARYGNVIHREEFTKLLMALDATPAGNALGSDARAALATALTRNGVANSGETLSDIRKLALRLEKSNPEMAQGVRQNIAILTAAETDLVAKINNWFDQTMDRTSQRFTASTRLITFVGAIIVAVGLQVDSVSLVNRLAADDTLRNSFVAQAVAMDQADKTKPPDEEKERQYRQFLAENGVIKLPTSAGWWESLAKASSATLGGILITALLLSLGAPFWYSALGRLLQLRSVIATKDDAQRAERQNATPPAEGVPRP